MRVVNSQWSVVSKSIFGLVLCAFLLVLCGAVEAQQESKTFKIGWLESGTTDRGSRLEEIFRHRLAELGFVEGKNISFEYRSADNKLDRLTALANELVHIKVDLLCHTGEPTIIA